MKKIIKFFGIIFVFLFGFCLFIFSNHIVGWGGFTVLSASMEPSIMTGSVVVTQYIHPSKLQKKDIITFIAPTKERLFITHRIMQVTHKDNLTVFKTKGDNNKNEDKWILAGGGVVGKVVYAIPYLGYFMSFAQSKIGIVLLILFPAAYIIIDEIFTIIHTIKHHRKKNNVTQQIAAVALFLFLSVIFFSPSPTLAILSDSVALTGNTFAIEVVSPSPTITPTPSDSPHHCGGNININISGNAAGSSNSVNASSNCSVTINQSNNSTIINSVHSEASTGNNMVINSTGSASITAGNAQVEIKVETKTASNSVEIK